MNVFRLFCWTLLFYFFVYKGFYFSTGWKWFRIIVLVDFNHLLRIHRIPQLWKPQQSQVPIAEFGAQHRLSPGLKDNISPFLVADPG